VTKTFIVYVAVQIVAYGLDFGLFWLIVSHAAMNPIIANVAGKVLAGIFAFGAHKTFTFRASASGRTTHEALRYFLLLLFNIPLSSGLLTILLWFAPPYAAKIAADVIGLGITFVLVRLIVFGSAPPEVKSVPQK
jgi:putative flippase GtrA